MSDLLPTYREKLSANLTVTQVGGVSKLVTKRIIKNLSIEQWSACFDALIVTWMPFMDNNRKDKLVADLLTYKKGIQWLAVTGHYWQSYERHFRQCAAGNESTRWGQLDFMLCMQYNASHATKINNKSPMANAQGTSREQLSNSVNQPAGSKSQGRCYAYNNQNEKCARNPCPYKHLCTQCGGAHPAFRCVNKAQSDARPQQHSFRNNGVHNRTMGGKSVGSANAN